VVFAVPVRGVAGVRLVDLVTDPLLVALPRGHRLCAARELSLADLAGERWVQGAPDVADELFAAAVPLDASPAAARLLDHLHAVAAALAGGRRG
jgi:hypothetical protein